MEDNYYKKGNSSSKVATEAEHGGRKAGSKHKTRAHGSGTRGGSKTNYNELGKGRIVESSQSGFAVQHAATVAPSCEQVWRKDSNENIKQMAVVVAGQDHHQSDLDTNQTMRGQVPVLNQDMSANSTGQRRGARHSHDNFATLHQTPQPVIQVAGGSGSSTPLTHLVQRRQFEMTQLPKSSSTASANAIESYNQQTVLAMHLQNPKMITTIQSRGAASQYLQPQTSSTNQKMATLQSADLQSLDKNMSTLSGGNLNSQHSRKVSANSAQKKIKQPQGGVFQSGPSSTINRTKTVGSGPHNILTNNFILGGTSPNAIESPQFVLHSVINGNHHEASQGKFNFASQMLENQHCVSRSITSTTDNLKTPNQEQLAQQKQLKQSNLHQQSASSSAHQTQTQSQQQIQSAASHAKTNTLTLSATPAQTGLAILSLQHQHSCGVPATTHASQFNTPSNCYQAQQLQSQNQMIGVLPDYHHLQQRSSMQTLQQNSAGKSNADLTGAQTCGLCQKKESVILKPISSEAGAKACHHQQSQVVEAHHLSQNSYELTAPLHMSQSQTPGGAQANRNTHHASIISNTQNSLVGNQQHQNSNSTLIANLVSNNTVQNTSAQHLPQQSTNVNNFTQHTQQAHPNLLAAVNHLTSAGANNHGGANGDHRGQASANGNLLQPQTSSQQLHQMNTQQQLQQNQQSSQQQQQLTNPAGGASNLGNNAAAQGHLSASQFDISALLRQQPSTTVNQHVLDFQELCSNTTHNAGAALKMSLEANTRDIDFLRQRFYAEYCYDTNDIITLYNYFMVNFQSFIQPVANNNGNQTTTINALQIANMSSYRQNPQHHHTITGPTGTKSTNVTAFGIAKSRHTTVNQHQTINFNSQSFDNQTMTTSHIQPRKVTKLIEIGAQLHPLGHTNTNAAVFGQIHNMQTQLSQVQDVTGGAGQDSTEIKHFTTGSVGNGYTPFDNVASNQKMFFNQPSHGGGLGQQDQMKGRRTQPCLRHHSTVSNRNNCTDTVSFHRDVPTPMMQREAQASVEAEDEKNEFSFEEPAIDGTNEHSIEEEEKSLINALSFKKQIAPLANGQTGMQHDEDHHLQEIDNSEEIKNQRGWATTKQETTPGLTEHKRNATRPLSKDQCGFTIQLSPINRFNHEQRSKQSVFEFYARHNRGQSLLNRGMLSAKRRIKKKGSTDKDGARKHLHRQLTQQTRTLSVLTRGQSKSTIYRLKTALQVIYLNGGTQLAIQEHFKKLMPRQSNFDTNDTKTVHYRDTTERNQSDVKRRRDKSTKGRGTSKSRKRQGSRNSRKQRIASLYRDSTSSIGDESASLPMFTHLSKDVNNKGSDFINVILPVSEVVHDAETTQDIQKLCKEIEDAEKKFVSKLNQDEDQFDKQMTQQVIQAERALQESRRESQTREKSMRGTRRGDQLSLAAPNCRSNSFKAQSLSSLNQAMQMPLVGMANATQKHLLQPSELYGTEGNVANGVNYAHTNDPIAPNTERPNAQSIEMRLALHHQTQQQHQLQNKAGPKGTSVENSNAQQLTAASRQQLHPQVRAEAKTQIKGKQRINVVSLLDQKSEPCLLKPKKLALDRQQVKLFGAINNTGNKAQSAQKEIETNFGVADETDMSANKTPNALKSGLNMQSLNAMQSTNSINSKRKLTFIKTKNINFHSLNKLSGRGAQPSSTSTTHQAAPGLRIKLQKTANGDCSTDRSAATTDALAKFSHQQTKSAQNSTVQCQSALATHKNIGKDLSQLNHNQQLMAKKNATQMGKNHHHIHQQSSSLALAGNQTTLAHNKNVAMATTAVLTDISCEQKTGVTPDKATAKIKYASARIKLLKVDTSADEASKKKNPQALYTASAPIANENNKYSGSPTSSGASTLGGYKHMRRLVEMLINEFYRKRGKSIKTVAREMQIDTLVDFWWQSLSQQKILGKLKGKLAKTGLVEKEKHLMNFLNGKDTQSLLTLQKHSTTRKYGELAVVQEQVLRLALDDYLTRSQ